MKTIKYNREVRDSIMAGVNALADAVSITLGPKGRNVIIDQPGLDPKVTKDGVTVAQHINLKDKLEDMGATVVKRVAEKSNDNAGDGTTTATVLTRAILKEGMKLIEAGNDPIQLQRGINAAAEMLVNELNKMAINVFHDSAMVENIATISANNDKEIGALVAEAFKKVGKDGAVSVEEGSGFETAIHKVDGLQFDRGMISTYFSSSPEKAEVSMKNPLILVVDGALTSTEEASAIISSVASTGRGLLVIAEDVSGNALSTFILNKMRGGHQIAAVKTPAFGNIRKDMAADISAIVGGHLLTPDQVVDIEPQYVDQLFGTASVVKVEQMNTIIMGGQGSSEKKKERIDAIDNEINNSKEITSFEISKLNERRAKLGGGVAVIEVGAKSEIEMKEIKDRIDDAKEAVISALEEGVVIGGGCALIRARQSVNQIHWYDEETPGFKSGANVLMRAVSAPFKQICDNANVSSDTRLQSVMSEIGNYGYNAKTDQMVDMIKEGILDPKKVTRIALESAASVAGTLITTGCALIEE